MFFKNLLLKNSNGTIYEITMQASSINEFFEIVTIVTPGSILGLQVGLKINRKIYRENVFLKNEKDARNSVWC